VKTGYNPPTLTALAENDVDTNDGVERDYKENKAGTEVNKSNRIRRIKEEKDL